MDQVCSGFVLPIPQEAVDVFLDRASRFEPQKDVSGIIVKDANDNDVKGKLKTNLFLT